MQQKLKWWKVVSSFSFFSLFLVLSFLVLFFHFFQLFFSFFSSFLFFFFFAGGDGSPNEIVQSSETSQLASSLEAQAAEARANNNTIKDAWKLESSSLRAKLKAIVLSMSGEDEIKKKVQKKAVRKNFFWNFSS